MPDPKLIAALVALADTCNYSVHAHYTEGHIRKKVRPNEFKQDLTKALKKLRSKGYAQIKKTRGGDTWMITKEGLEEIRKGFVDL